MSTPIDKFLEQVKNEEPWAKVCSLNPLVVQRILILYGNRIVRKTFRVGMKTFMFMGFHIMSVEKMKEDEAYFFDDMFVKQKAFKIDVSEEPKVILSSEEKQMLDMEAELIKLKEAADPDCKRCYGRGYSEMLKLNYSDTLLTPVECRCIYKKAKKFQKVAVN